MNLKELIWFLALLFTNVQVSLNSSGTQEGERQKSEFHASSVDTLHPLRSVRVSIEPVQLILTNHCSIPQCVSQQEKILCEFE